MTRDVDIARSSDRRDDVGPPGGRERVQARRDRRRPSRPDRDRGQALAELALVAPVMLLIMVVAVDFGRLFFSYIAVTNAAREATSYAAAHAADTPWDATAYRTAATGAGSRETNVQSQGSEGTLTITDPVCFDPATSVTINCHSASNFAGGIGNQVRVTASQPFTFITPIIGDLLGGTFTLSASTTAPVLNPPDTAIYAAPAPSSGPTPTPTSSPSPTPTPSPAPTLPPGATPSPSPSPTPTPTPIPMCTVPDLDNMYYNDLVLQAWHNNAGFTGTLEDRTDGKKIKAQQYGAGASVACSTGMWVDDK